MSAYEFLPDPVKGKNVSPVFVQVTAPAHSLTEERILLRNPGTAGLRLRRLRNSSESSTVVYEVVGRPWVRVGRAPPVNPQSDIEDIKRVLGSACELID